MEKNKFLWLTAILMLLSVSFVACSDDEEESVGSVSELVGTWESVSYTYWWKENGNIVEEGTERESNIRVAFYEDGTCNSAEYYNGRWNWDEAGTWSYKNGKITIKRTFGGESYSETSTVKELTSSKLVIEYIDKYTEDGISYEDYELSEYRKISD